MPNKKSCEPSREIRIWKAGGEICRDLKHLANHAGITESAYLKNKLVDIAKSYPEHMRKEPIMCEPNKEIRIRGVGAVKAELHNIALHLGVEPNAFIEVKIAEMVVNQPAYMKIALPE